LREGRSHEGESFGGYEEELERFEDRLEEMIQEIRRAKEEIRSEIRKAKLMIVIGFTALTAFQILLRWIWF
jgi:hypothetical protein